MSAGYDNVVVGKLKLKGKALDGGGGMKKQIESEGRAEVLTDVNKEEVNKSIEVGSSANWDNNLTRYMEERERIDSQKLAKTSNKSHRDRIEDFNHYLANMSEHYDIPKVGPG